MNSVINKAPWPPATHALTYHRLAHPGDKAPTSLLVSHPTAPYTKYLPAEPGNEVLQVAAYDYLDELDKHLGTLSKSRGLDLPAGWLDALAPGVSSDRFGWLALGTPPADGDLITSLASQKVERSTDLQNKKANVDRTWILLAGEKSDKRFLGSGFGLRVVMHQRTETKDRKQRIDMTAMSAVLPYGRFREPGKKGKPAVLPVDKLIEKLKPEIENRLNLAKLVFRGVRLYGVEDVPGRSRFAIRATAFGDPVPRGGSGACDVFAEGSRLTSAFTIDRLKKSSLTARAAHARAPVAGMATAPAFIDDPMTSLHHHPDEGNRRRRPTRSEPILDSYRDLKLFPTLPLRTTDFLIEPSRFVRSDLDLVRKNLEAKAATPDKDIESIPKSVNLPGGRLPPARSNDFPALGAYQHTARLFELMRNYGIDSNAYFRRARKPLRVFYRSGIAPGPGKDGQTVNARVNRQLSRDQKNPDQRPFIEVHLALANLSHRDRAPWNGRDRSQAETLGIATASRWMWHEFGHVLLIATLGELELRFAHSPGDALAAILADPHSRLAEDPQQRGYTFPWTYPRRRHDRSVLNGWAWGGTMNSTATVASGNVIKGYRAEQILSTTLFRLYRCLGGDTTKLEKDNDDNELTVPDRDAREAAAHYTVFLIMRALQLAALPPLRVEDFVDLLIQADIATKYPFKATLRSGGGSPERIGGTAHKLIRWAFEAQGLYQTNRNPTTPINAPGQPPAVDIYIPDNRPKTELTQAGNVTYSTPGYVPVSLDWAAKPAWHSAEDALRIDKDQVEIEIKNRGLEKAKGVEVRVWWRKKPANLGNLVWDQGNSWTECNSPNTNLKGVPASGSTEFGPFTNLPKGRGGYLFFAQATCENDRANSDPATGLPCSTAPTRLVDLVAGDNNLGLWIRQL